LTCRHFADKSNSGAFILPSSDLVSKQLNNSGAGKARAFISRALTGRAKQLSRAPHLRSAPASRKNKICLFFFNSKNGGREKGKNAKAKF